MKTNIGSFLLLHALTAGLVLITAGRATAQTFTTLYNFDAAPGKVNIYGAYPFGGVVFSGNTLYGTTWYGGSSGFGTVYALNTQHTNISLLNSFDGANDEAYSYAGLLLSGNTLYGTTQGSGTTSGTVFAVNTNGTGFKTLYIFTPTSNNGTGTNSDGAFPYGVLILSSNTLYGTTQEGGSGGNGTVFAVNTDGRGFTNLHSFTATIGSAGDGYNGVNGTNGDGAQMYGPLVLLGDSDTLYGTASVGGTNGNGTVFCVKTNGSGFRTLYTFSSGFFQTNYGTIVYINSDGANPVGALVLSGNTLYGTTWTGGTNGTGVIFAVNTDGTGFTNLHSFSGGSGSLFTNSDGVDPIQGLTLSGHTLYGTAFSGGNGGAGTLFAINTGGTGFTTLYNFTAVSGTDGIDGLGSNSDGAYPIARLTLAGNILYGTASRGGALGNGTVFSLTLPEPQLTITASGTNVILAWPTNALVFTLQCTTSLVPSAAWSTVTNVPAVVNGQNTVTNSISGSQMFFRLSQ